MQDRASLFARLLGMAFEDMTGTAPVVVTVGAAPAESHIPLSGWLPWEVDEVAAPSDLSGAVSEHLVNGPVLAVPSWERLRRRNRWGAMSEHEEFLFDCAPSESEYLLVVLVPAATLTSARTGRLREILREHWNVELVIYATGAVPTVHHSFELAAIFLAPSRGEGTAPIRMFRLSSDADESAVMTDFQRLLMRNGGRGAFGYVLHGTDTAGESLSFDRHDPKLLARAADLSHLGATVPLDNLFSLLLLLHDAVDSNLYCERGVAGAVRVLSGRDLKRDGSIAPPDESTRWAQVPDDRCLSAGDILVQAIHRSTDPLLVAEVDSTVLPASALHTVIVMSPRRVMNMVERDFVLQYLRSEPARQLLLGVRTGSVGLGLSALRQLLVPQPDEELSAAFQDLANAAEQFDAWRGEATDLLQSVFHGESAGMARARLVRSGRLLRLRADAAAILDDESHAIRTRFPYPIAYRWREVEALRSAGNLETMYGRLLATAEVLLCYVANLALAFTKRMSIELGSVANIRAQLDRGRGLGFGDWVAVVKEVCDSRKYRNLPDAGPLASLRSILASSESNDACVRLTARRNDLAHGRIVDNVDLQEAVDAAMSDLLTLLREADCLTDIPLIHVTAVRWDSMRRQARISYRELVGDHPIVPTRSIDYPESNVEEDSLYVLDDRHCLHLLRPFLTGRTCPKCRSWSTFHVDRASDSEIFLKSLEHGHDTSDASLIEPLRQVGVLLP